MIGQWSRERLHDTVIGGGSSLDKILPPGIYRWCKPEQLKKTESMASDSGPEESQPDMDPMMEDPSSQGCGAGAGAARSRPF